MALKVVGSNPIIHPRKRRDIRLDVSSFSLWVWDSNHLKAICRWHIARFRLDGIGSLQFLPQGGIGNESHDPPLRKVSALYQLIVVLPEKIPDLIPFQVRYLFFMLEWGDCSGFYRICFCRKVFLMRILHPENPSGAETIFLPVLSQNRAVPGGYMGAFV